MKKKGESMSLNVIIVAAIALIVLVILVLIFTGKIRLFTKEINDCGKNGGSCVDIANYNSGDDACKAWGGDYATSKLADCIKVDSAGKEIRDASKVCCITATK